MDKFGIFKILSSLLGFYTEQSANKSPAFNDSEEKNGENKIPDFGEILKLFNGNNQQKNDTINSESPPPAPDEKNDKKSKKTNNFALKNRLFETATNHDEFVKKVMQKNRG